MKRNAPAAIFVALWVCTACARADDPLPSWNDGPSKQAILAFVDKVTRPGGPEFVPVEDRIATFDNDGTLWSEKPVYFQFVFTVDHAKDLSPRRLAWADMELFQAAVTGDIKALTKLGERNIVELVMATHTGVTTEEFEAIVEKWITTARHPRFDRPYTDLVFQPMLELLAYLRANGFKTYIVSGGGIEFMRPWAERVYGVVPEQVIGSSVKTKYEMRDGKPVLERLPELDFLDDKAGKPVAINQFIGRRPIAAFGNSDGDLEMLQWTTSGSGPRFGLVVHHTDAKREWAYDRKSWVGKLDKALDAAPKNGWTVVDMKNEWKVIYPFEREEHEKR